ncbi:NmrA family NAD(P)-binding protein [Streptomyces scopuliridis]|uniref:NmrA family NAD(P)-binding protein n=1 Tax=Streptomyces scopuliridis TaxID=452529 RepID=UPI00367B5A55
MIEDSLGHAHPALGSLAEGEQNGELGHRRSVIGATGCAGSRVSAAPARAGHTVLGLARDLDSPAARQLTIAEATPVQGDFSGRRPGVRTLTASTSACSPNWRPPRTATADGDTSYASWTTPRPSPARPS